jgi:hypothetical protein
MIDITKDIQSLTTFRNNSVKIMQRLKKTAAPSSSLSTANPKPSSRTPPPTSVSSISPPWPTPKKVFVKAWTT